MRAPSTAGWPRRKPAAARMSSSSGPSAVPSLSPWPRKSSARTANPWRAASRQKPSWRALPAAGPVADYQPGAGGPRRRSRGEVQGRRKVESAVGSAAGRWSAGGRRSRASPRACHVRTGLVDAALQIGHVGEVAVELVVVEAVAHEEVVGHLEAPVADLEVDQPQLGTVEEDAGLQRAGPAQAERAYDVVEREPRVDHVLHDDDVLVLDRLVEVLEEADGFGAGLGVLLGVGADARKSISRGRSMAGPDRPGRRPSP